MTTGEVDGPCSIRIAQCSFTSIATEGSVEWLEAASPEPDTSSEAT